MSRLFHLVLVCWLFLADSWPAAAQRPWPPARLQVSADGHYLLYADGTPFFWLGDTGWELFHRLTRGEILTYLENRRRKGFTVIQAVILPEFDGLRTPNRYGQVPFLGLDPDRPNPAYFSLVDWVVQAARQKHLFLGLLPTWGDKVARLWGQGPVVFNPANAYRYGLFLGRRYAASPNIIWILGGDRPALNDSADWRPVWRAMARGIREGTGGNALITYHTSGGAYSTSQQMPQEDWLQINTMQSGHGSGHDVPVWAWITRDRGLNPVKPTLDAEPNYEDHPVNPWPVWNPANGYFRAYDVRKQLYRSVFAGACGVTYGHHAVWQFYSPREAKINHADRYWTQALDRPGAFQAGYLRRLIESRDPVDRIPDSSLLEGPAGSGGQHREAFRDREGRYAMVYLPQGGSVVVDGTALRAPVLQAWWYDPRKGRAIRAGRVPRSDRMAFRAPSEGFGMDWVLVLDVPAAWSAAPGQPPGGATR
ncbi:MAG TPA: glycoside hydrolase family 140 protein [Chitinophagaceae bacterium]|nr:glycoside hydrolase family 140 protein [Chitinophagaceae bacterium]